MAAMTGQQPSAGGRFGQLTFTSYDDGRGRGGWRAKDDRGLDAGERRALEAAITTQLAIATPIPQFPTPDEQAALPRRLLYAPAATGGVAYWHSAPAGPDATGRPGNVFVHVVLDRTPDAPDPAFRSPDLWRSAHWLAPYGHAQVLDAAPEVHSTFPWRDGPLDRTSVLRFLLDPQQWRVDVLAGLLDATTAAMRRRAQPGSATPEPPTGVVLGASSPESGAYWVAAIAQFMSPSTSRRFHWSTLEAPSNLAAVFAQGVHLAVVPIDYLADVPAGHVVLHEQEQLKPGLPGADPHRTEAGSEIEVTPWSSVVREVLQDLPTAERALELQDSVASAVEDRNLDPGWALGMAVAQMPELEDAYADAALLVGDVAPVGLRDAPALKHVRTRLLGGRLGGSTEDAYAQARELPVDSREGEAAWLRYLERAFDDDRWLQRPEGVPLPVRSSGLWRHRETFADQVRHRLDQVLTAPGSEPLVETALLAIRLADVVVRGGLHATADGAQLLQTTRLAVDRWAAPVLVDAEASGMLLAAVGPLDEGTQQAVLRPVLAEAVEAVPRPRGDRLTLPVLRWLFPVPPRPPGLEETAGAGPRPDALVRELAAQVTSVVADPSAFALQALADVIAELPAAPGDGPSRAEQEVGRLLSGRTWRPAELRVVAGRAARSPAVAETLLRAVVADRTGDDLDPLLVEIERSARGRTIDGVDTTESVLLAAVRARRLAAAWWRGPGPEVTTRKARELISTVVALLPALVEHGLGSDRFSDDLLASVSGGVAVAAVCWPDGDIPIPLGQEFLAALRDEQRLVVTKVGAAVRYGVVSEAELVHAALCGAPGFPLVDTIALPARRLALLEVTVDRQRAPLLDHVVERRVRQNAINVTDVNERVMRMIGQQLPRALTPHEVDHQVRVVRAFAQDWWAQRGAARDLVSVGSRLSRVARAVNRREN
jgi:GTPase-associated protein 1, N-terminal domain type 2